ncbi:hypothetical protein MMC10_000912 [Thelotrema lepadinum]|nr:hypothetical protein [Thelotrema lepadinum]
MPTSDASSSDPLTNLPPLDFEPAQSSKDRTDALKLVSDSVTQQRSTASSTLVFHPLTLAIFVTLIAGAYPLLVKRSGDLPILFTTGVGIFMMILGIIRYIVKPYEDLAENINWNWLGDDEMVVALYGGTVIGTCVYRIEQGSKKKSGSGSPGSGGKRALIRAWTVRRRERGRGIGRGLLERLVDICAKEKGCDGIEFAPVGLRAGAERVLPDWTAGGGLMKFNSELDRREARAEECLKDVMREKRFGDKKRRGSR